ncbi:MAG: MotA/TolQ/ExbB proton channel family protein [Thermodesulfobacteriota bacterium]
METLPETSVLVLLAHATITVKFVLGMLVTMSLGSWSIIIYKYFLLAKARRSAADDHAVFVSGDTLGESMRTLSRNQSSPVYRVGAGGLNELRRLESAGLLTSDRMGLVMNNLRRVLRSGVSSQLKVMTSNLSFLATCANAAPFIGLFGTVWGIMHAFQTIGQMQSAALAAVAPGISEALIATAVGLAVAIPATIAYNFFLGMVNVVETELVNFAGAFLNTVQRELSKSGVAGENGHHGEDEYGI